MPAPSLPGVPGSLGEFCRPSALGGSSIHTLVPWPPPLGLKQSERIGLADGHRSPCSSEALCWSPGCQTEGSRSTLCEVGGRAVERGANRLEFWAPAVRGSTQSFSLASSLASPASPLPAPQVKIFEEDFQRERSDRERMNEEKEELKKQVEKLQAQVTLSNAQVRRDGPRRGR